MFEADGHALEDGVEGERHDGEEVPDGRGGGGVGLGDLVLALQRGHELLVTYGGGGRELVAT